MADQSNEATLRDVPGSLLVRWLLVAAAMVGAVVGLHVYLGVRLIDDAQVPAPWASLAWAALWASFLSIFAGFIGGRVLPRRLAKVAQWVGFVWMGAFGLLLVTVGVSDVLLLVTRQFTDVGPDWPSWRALGVFSLVAPAMAWGFFVSSRPVVKRVTVRVPGLDPALDGFRIAQISDVHIGETLGRDFAEAVAAQVNALDADLVAVTGDLVDGSVRRLRHEVEPLGAMRARHGVFYVTGNHEYYHGGPQWLAEGRRLGWTALQNEHRVVADGKLVVGGVTDLEGARFSPAHAPRVDVAFDGAPAGVPRVLLAHQPRFARHAKAQGVALMLSGHTHGGQIFPFNFFVKLQQPVVGGLEVIEGVLTYTSLGTGYWGPPFRIGPRGEVTELTLRPA